MKSLEIVKGSRKKTISIITAFFIIRRFESFGQFGLKSVFRDFASFPREYEYAYGVAPCSP